MVLRSKKVNTTKKLWIGFGVVIAILILIGFPLSLWLHALKNRVGRLTTVVAPGHDDIVEMQNQINRIGVLVSSHVEKPDPDLRARIEKDLTEFPEHLGELLTRSDSAAIRELGSRAEELFDGYRDRARRFISAGGTEPPDAELQTFHALRAQLDRLFEEELQPISMNRLRSERQQIRSNANALLVTTITLLLIGVSAALITSVVVARGVLKAEQTLRVTVASIGDGLITTDEHRRITYMNPIAESLTGWKNADAEGQLVERVFQIVNEATGESAEDPVAKALRTREIVGLANHTMLISKNGERRLIDDSAAPIRARGGRTTGVVLIFRDVTERRRNEQAQREVVARKAAVLNTALDGVITIDHRGHVVEFNRAAEGIFGFSQEEVIGQELAELIVPPAFRERHRQGIAQCLKTGEGPILNQRLEMTALRSDGSEFPIEVAITRLAGQDPPFFTSYLRDISQRKQQEAELDERLRLLALGADVGKAVTQGENLRQMLQFCAEAIVCRLNAAFARIWTLNAAENILELQASAGLYTHIDGGHARVPVGKFKIGLIALERQPHLTNAVIGDPRVPEQEWAKREGLTSFAGFPLQVEGRLVGVLAMFGRQPLTQTTLDAIESIAQEVALGIRQREVEQELLEANETLEERVEERTAKLMTTNLALERSNRELEQFASVASHDLQEPLRKIQAFGDRLQMKYHDALDETGRDYVHRMQAAATRMRRLIDDLLTFSRVTTKAQPFESVDLNEVAEEVIADLEGRIHGEGGRVEIGPLPTLDADRLQMRQLLQNLIANGLKFHRPDLPPVVEVSARVLERAILAGTSGVQPLQAENLSAFAPDGAQPAVELTVRDNGIGFEEVYLDRIFEVFQRLHGRLEYEGTGMGLAICRKIVERHGGAITAHSAPNERAAFIITLPLRQPANDSTAP